MILASALPPNALNTAYLCSQSAPFRRVSRGRGTTLNPMCLTLYLVNIICPPALASAATHQAAPTNVTRWPKGLPASHTPPAPQLMRRSVPCCNSPRPSNHQQWLRGLRHLASPLGAHCPYPLAMPCCDATHDPDRPDKKHLLCPPDSQQPT